MSFRILEGSTTNFAGSFGDHLLQIRNGIINGMRINHEVSGIRSYDQDFIVPRRTTIDISLILPDNGMIITNYGGACQPLVRNKFVVDCSIEELLVAIQSKLAAG